MTDATTQAALSLLERLREMGQHWNRRSRPVLAELRPVGMGMLRWIQEPHVRVASEALRVAGYHDAVGRSVWLPMIGDAIEALKGATT